MIEVFVSLSRDGHDLPLGSIYVDSIRGKDAYSFEFDPQALTQGYASALPDQDLMPIAGRQYKADSSTPYHFIADSSPNRWGRNLLRKANGGKALRDIDCLLGVSDASRMGALRYSLQKGGPFLSSHGDIPPYRYLRELEEAAYSFDAFAKGERWKSLLEPGSSLGGARPKASIYGNDKTLYLAKFSHKHDDYDVPGVEYLTYLLACESGVKMAPSKLLSIGERHSVFLTQRFDRKDGQRIHYSSFMTLLHAAEGDSSSYTYLDVAEKISQLSTAPKEDLRQMFLRVAFSLLAHNYDDHLRNHAMMYIDKGWRLSPAFDLNISFDQRSPTLPIGEGGDGINALVMCSPYFGIACEEGMAIVSSMKRVLHTVLPSAAKKPLYPRSSHIASVSYCPYNHFASPLFNKRPILDWHDTRFCQNNLQKRDIFSKPSTSLASFPFNFIKRSQDSS